MHMYLHIYRLKGSCVVARRGKLGWETGRFETELSFFGYHGTDAVYLKGTVL